MPDHIDIYKEVQTIDSERNALAEAERLDLEQLDSGFLQSIQDWVDHENVRLAQHGYSEQVGLALEERGSSLRNAPCDWERGLAPDDPAAHKVRHFVAYRPALGQDLSRTYLIIFDYSYRDMGASLQLLRCGEDGPQKLAEQFPRVLGEADGIGPVDKKEIPEKLTMLLTAAAEDYRKLVAERAWKEAEAIHGAPGIKG